MPLRPGLADFMKEGATHSPETRARLSEKGRVRMSDPAVRAKISEDTKARMADPAVRRKISEGTRRASEMLPELLVLREAWRGARSSVRRKFLEELLAPLFDGPEDGA
jgi:hypothetical protein